MKWYVEVTTGKGKYTLPFVGGYRTKRDAEEVAEMAKAIEANKAVKIYKK